MERIYGGKINGTHITIYRFFWGDGGGNTSPIYIITDRMEPRETVYESSHLTEEEASNLLNIAKQRISGRRPLTTLPFNDLINAELFTNPSAEPPFHFLRYPFLYRYGDEVYLVASDSKNMIILQMKTENPRSLNALSPAMFLPPLSILKKTGRRNEIVEIYHHVLTIGRHTAVVWEPFPNTFLPEGVHNIIKNFLSLPQQDYDGTLIIRKVQKRSCPLSYIGEYIGYAGKVKEIEIVSDLSSPLIIKGDIRFLREGTEYKVKKWGDGFVVFYEKDGREFIIFPLAIE